MVLPGALGRVGGHGSDGKDDLLVQAPPRWRVVSCRIFALLGVSALIVVIVLLVPGTERPTQTVTVDDGRGFCVALPSVASAVAGSNPPGLRWGSDPATADRICCNQHRYAEWGGYWLSTSFPRTVDESELPIEFYDVASQKLLYRAPVGRSYAEFIRESTAHAWPSFRDAEMTENVVVKSD